MAQRRRVLALAVAAVALALTVTGVVIAATDSTSGTRTHDPLALNGYPPKSADLLVTMSSGSGSGSGVSLSARVHVDFVTGRVDAFLTFPLVITTVDVEARAIAGEVYLRSADESTGPWLVTPLKLPSFFGVSLELTKPDIDLVSGYHERVTKSGYLTTYRLTQHHAALGSLLGRSVGTDELGSIDWTITVGSQGEVTASTLRVTSGASRTTISARVLDYNKSVKVVTPSAKEVTPLKDSTLREILKSKELAGALFPSNLFAPGHATLS